VGRALLCRKIPSRRFELIGKFDCAVVDYTADALSAAFYPRATVPLFDFHNIVDPSTTESLTLYIQSREVVRLKIRRAPLTSLVTWKKNLSPLHRFRDNRQKRVLLTSHSKY